MQCSVVVWLRGPGFETTCCRFEICFVHLLSEETLKTVGPFYLGSMPREVKYGKTCHGLSAPNRAGDFYILINLLPSLAVIICSRNISPRIKPATFPSLSHKHLSRSFNCSNNLTSRTSPLHFASSARRQRLVPCTH